MAMNEHSEVLARLATSRFRSRFRLGARERAYAEAKGRDTIERHACDFVAQRLGPAIPRNDGRQTPMRGHPVFAVLQRCVLQMITTDPGPELII